MPITAGGCTFSSRREREEKIFNHSLAGQNAMSHREGDSYHHHLLTLNDTIQDLAEMVVNPGGETVLMARSAFTNTSSDTLKHQEVLEGSCCSLGTLRDNAYVGAEVSPGDRLHIPYCCVR